MKKIEQGFASREQVEYLTSSFSETSKKLGLEDKKDARALPRISYGDLAVNFGDSGTGDEFEVTSLKDRVTLQKFVVSSGARGLAKVVHKGRSAIFPAVVLPHVHGELPMLEALTNEHDRVDPRDPNGAKLALNSLQHQLLDMALAQNLPGVGAESNCSSTRSANVGDIAHASLIASRVQAGNIHKDAHRLGQSRQLSVEAMSSATIFTGDGHARQTATSRIPVHLCESITFSKFNQVSDQVEQGGLDAFAAGAGLVMAATATRVNSLSVAPIDIIANQQAMVAR